MLSLAHRGGASRALAGAARRHLCVVTAGSEDAVSTALAGEKPVVLYFTATWCGPCRMISPVFAELAKETPAASFLKVDVDELAEVAQDHSIAAMPTFQFYKGGQLMDTIVGADVAKLKAAVQKL